MARFTDRRRGSGAAGSLFTISYIQSGATSGSGGTSNPAIPYPVSGIVSGDLLVMQITSRDAGTNLATPSGWTAIEATTGGFGVDGPDSGDIRLETFYRQADGTETGNVSFTVGTTGYIGFMRQYRKTGGTWSVGSTTGSNTTPLALWTATGASWTVAGNDAIVCATGWNANGGSVTVPTFTMLGLSGSPVSMGNDIDYASTGGNDQSTHAADCFLTGAATDVPVFTATFSTVTANSPAGVTHFIRLRAT